MAIPPLSSGSVKPLKIKKRPSALCLNSFSPRPSPDEKEFPFTPQDLPTSAEELGSWGTWNDNRQKRCASSDVYVSPLRRHSSQHPTASSSPSALPNISICSRGYLHLTYGPRQARPSLLHSRSHVNLSGQSARTDHGPSTLLRRFEHGRRASLPSLRAEHASWSNSRRDIPPVPSLPPAIRHRSSSSAPALLHVNSKATRWKPLPPTPELLSLAHSSPNKLSTRGQDLGDAFVGQGCAYGRIHTITAHSEPTSPTVSSRIRAASVDTALDAPQRPSLASHASDLDGLALPSISSRRRLGSSGGCASGAPLENQYDTVKVKVLVISTGDLFAFRLDAVFGSLRDLRRALMLRNAVSISTGTLLCFAVMQLNAADTELDREKAFLGASAGFGAVIASDMQLRQILSNALRLRVPLRLEAF